MQKSMLAILLGLAFGPRFMVTEEGGKAIPIEELMDASLDDIADLPGFVVPPQGHYKLAVSLEKKVVNDVPSIEAGCTVMETLELDNKDETPVEPGTKFSQLFMMNNEWGQGGFKGFVSPIATGLGLQNPKVSQVVEAVQNITITAVIKHRYHKEDKQKPVAERRTYANLTNVEVQ